MNSILFWMNQAFAVSYVPHADPPLDLPLFPDIIIVERITLLFLFFILIRSLLTEQADPKKEKDRINLIRLSVFAAALALFIHLYRFLAGI